MVHFLKIIFLFCLFTSNISPDNIDELFQRVNNFLKTHNLNLNFTESDRLTSEQIKIVSEASKYNLII